jgi:cyclic pyranopterin phosphate synthase
LFSNIEVDIKQVIRKLARDKDEGFLRKKIIRDKLKEAVKLKPEGHKLNLKNQENLSFHMSRIGG